MAKEISIPSIVLIFDRKKKASDTTTGTVEIRITHNRKQKYLSTGIKLFPRQWKNGRAANMREAGEINMQLDMLMSKIRHVVTEMTETGNIDIFDIPRKIKNIQDRTSLINYIHERAEIRKYGKKNDTAKRYDRFIRMLEQYGGSKTFSDISEQAIMQYDKYLTAKGMTQYSKWQNYHRFLNSFINDAIQDGLIKSNPYRTLHIDKDKTVKSLSRHLTLAEIKKIEKTKMPAESLERTKDVFLFQTYTCLAYTDLKTFNSSKIKTINGMKAYTGNRDKTGKEFVIPLIKQAVRFLSSQHVQL